jgi:hypothetical protein
MVERLFFFDLLENLIVSSIGDYYYNDQIIGIRYNPNYFEEYIPGELFNSFTLEVRESLRMMSESDQNEFILSSYNQIVTHSPEKRIDSIYYKYRHIVAFNNSGPELSFSHKQDVNPALRAYKVNFKKFKTFVEQLHYNHHNGTLNLTSHIFGDIDSENDLSIPLKEEITNDSDKSSLGDVDKTNQLNSDNGFDETAPFNTEIEHDEIIKSMRKQHETFLENEMKSYMWDWIECRTTLKQWQERPDSEVFKLVLQEEDFSDISLYEFYKHLDKLFTEYVDIKASGLIENIKSIYNNEQALICAKRDLALLEDLIEGNIDSLKEKRLKTSFAIKDWQRVHLQFDQIFRDLYTPHINHDIFHEDSFADAQSILKYKEFLTSFITPKPEQDNLYDPLDFSFPVPAPVEIAKRQISNEEMEGLFQDWIAGRTTLTEWKSFPDSNVVNTFDRMTNYDEDYKVLSHQMYLYGIYVKNLTDSYINNFNNSSNPKIKSEKAHRDLSLIVDLINGNIFDEKIDLLSNVFSIDNWQLIHRQINYFIDYEGDPIDATTDIHSPDCLAIGESIFKYKSYLEEYLDPIGSPQNSAIKGIDLDLVIVGKKNQSQADGQQSINMAYTLLKESTLCKLDKKAFHDKITEHVKCLKDSGFLKNDNSNIGYFKQIFRNEKPDNKIQWVQGKSSLSWYIHMLIVKGIIVKDYDIFEVSLTLFDYKLNAKDSGTLIRQDPPAIKKQNLILKAIKILE